MIKAPHPHTIKQWMAKYKSEPGILISQRMEKVQQLSQDKSYTHSNVSLIIDGMSIREQLD